MNRGEKRKAHAAPPEACPEKRQKLEDLTVNRGEKRKAHAAPPEACPEKRQKLEDLTVSRGEKRKAHAAPPEACPEKRQKLEDLTVNRGEKRKAHAAPPEACPEKRQKLEDLTVNRGEKRKAHAAPPEACPEKRQKLDNMATLTVKELRQLCKERGLPCDFTKELLPNSSLTRPLLVALAKLRGVKTSGTKPEIWKRFFNERQEFNRTDMRKLTAKELRQLCKEKGIQCHFTKAKLVDHLTI